MMLTGPEIQRQVRAKRIILDPFDPKRVQPNSYDLTLHPTIAWYFDSELDCKKDNKVDEMPIPAEGMLLHPGKLYLGCINEIAGSDYFVPMLNGKSSLGRLGLFVHITAGFGDIGFKSKWVLEFVVVQPLRIYAHMPVAQISFFKPVGRLAPYKGKYIVQDGPVRSMMFKNFQGFEKAHGSVAK